MTGDRNMSERWVCEECLKVMQRSDEHVVIQYPSGPMPEVRVHPECRVRQLEKNKELREKYEVNIQRKAPESVTYLKPEY